MINYVLISDAEDDEDKYRGMYDDLIVAYSEAFVFLQNMQIGKIYMYESMNWGEFESFMLEDVVTDEDLNIDYLIDNMECFDLDTSEIDE